MSSPKRRLHNTSSNEGNPNKRIVVSNINNNGDEIDIMHTNTNTNEMTRLSDDSLFDVCFLLETNKMFKEIDTIFDTELSYITHSESPSDLLYCLKRLNVIFCVLNIQCRSYLIHKLRNHLKILCSMKTDWPLIVNERVIVAIRSYMIFNYISELPEGLLHYIFGWLSIENFSSLLSVNKEWSNVATNDNHWKFFYNMKFSISVKDMEIINYLKAYSHRLQHPFLNDAVEIAWRGKFRLEGLDVYRGLAWWRAKIVDRHVAQDKYKVHYDGWDSRWDEWVPRSRVRWPFNFKTTCDGSLKIIKRDEVIEVWCQGNHVPGAWLEARVKRIRGTRLQLDKVQMNELPLWVDQHLVRVLKDSYDQEGKTRNVEDILEGEQTDTTQVDVMNCGIL